MVNQILHRAKRIGDGRWQEGYYIHLHQTTYCCNPGEQNDKDNEIHRIVYETMTDWNLPNDHRMADIDPDTLGRWTGLCDKKGKRIFEGDILRYFGKSLLVWWNDEAFQWQAKETEEVTCSFDGFVSDWDNIDFGWLGSEYALSGGVSYEVIGNRWDTPELLGWLSKEGRDKPFCF